MTPEIPDLYYYLPAASSTEVVESDVCIYGGISGAVAAAGAGASHGEKGRDPGVR